jgi:hypothetical protein
MATHRRSMSGMKVEETEKWGRDTAYQRYGKPEHFHGAPNPPDKSRPQDPVDKHDKNYDNDVPVSSWLRGGNESGKPRR